MNFSNGSWLKNTYDGAGSVIKREKSNGESWQYVDRFVIKNGQLYSINIPDGRLIKNGSNWEKEFYYKDHLGSSVVTFSAQNGQLIAKEYAPVDPFGVDLFGINQSNTTKDNFTYQAKEKLDDFGILGSNDFGARIFDKHSLRWWGVDDLSGKMPWNSPFVYSFNNPINRIDPDGNMDFGVNDVRPNKEALIAIKNGLTASDVQHVKLDSKGMIDKQAINSVNSESGNFNALKQLVNDTRVYDIKVTDKFTAKDENGKESVQSMGVLDYNDYLTGEKLAEPEGRLGYTATPGKDGQINSPDSEVKIIINSGLNQIDRSKNIAHEAYGHGYLYSKGLPYEHKAIGMKETNLILKEQIKNRVNETATNFNKSN